MVKPCIDGKAHKIETQFAVRDDGRGTIDRNDWVGCIRCGLSPGQITNEEEETQRTEPDFSDLAGSKPHYLKLRGESRRFQTVGQITADLSNSCELGRATRVSFQLHMGRDVDGELIQKEVAVVSYMYPREGTDDEQDLVIVNLQFVERLP
jgi:hypothetical protein